MSSVFRRVKVSEKFKVLVKDKWGMQSIEKKWFWILKEREKSMKKAKRFDVLRIKKKENHSVYKENPLSTSLS